MKTKTLLVNNPLLGADPELFLYSNKEERFIPVCGLVGGTKEKPLPITDDGHALQEDGCAIEFCIPPCKTVDDFVSNIDFVKNYINDTVLEPLGLVSKAIPSARFDLDLLKNPKANMSGCDPDYNAYTHEENFVDSDDIQQKGAGGHIHIGYDNPSADVNILLIKAMDLFVGVPSVLLDSDRLRKKLYGKAGCHRMKVYGKLN